MLDFEINQIRELLSKEFTKKTTAKSIDELIKNIDPSSEIGKKLAADPNAKTHFKLTLILLFKGAYFSEKFFSNNKFDASNNKFVFVTRSYDEIQSIEQNYRCLRTSVNDT